MYDTASFLRIPNVERRADVFNIIQTNNIYGVIVVTPIIPHTLAGQNVFFFPFPIYIFNTRRFDLH